jgi:hypothetical protein
VFFSHPPPPVPKKIFDLKPNSLTYNLVEVPVHNLESSRVLRGFRIQSIFIKTSFKSLLLGGRGSSGGVNPLVKVTVYSKEETLVPITSKNSASGLHLSNFDHW